MPRTPYFGRRQGILIDIDLNHADLVAHFAGNLIEAWRDRFAGTAPFGPEVDNDWLVGLDHVAFERGIRGMRDIHIQIPLLSGAKCTFPSVSTDSMGTSSPPSRMGRRILGE